MNLFVSSTYHTATCAGLCKPQKARSLQQGPKARSLQRAHLPMTVPAEDALYLLPSMTFLKLDRPQK